MGKKVGVFVIRRFRLVMLFHVLPFLASQDQT